MDIRTIRFRLISPAVTYREPLLLFHYDGKTLADISASAVRFFSKDFAARGLALGDFDNDGSVDVLIAINNGAPLLLREQGRGWPQLAGRAFGRQDVQSGRNWRAREVDGRGLERHRDEDRRRKLSFRR